MIGPFAIGRVHRVEALASLREMPDESVDAIVADPPYSSGGFTRGDRVLLAPERKYVENEERAVPHASFAGDNRDARSWAAWMTLWLDEAHRLTRVGGRCYVFADWRQLPAATDAIQAGGWVWRGIVAWDKTEGSRAPHTGYHRHQTEFAPWGTRGPCPERLGEGPFAGVVRCSVDRDKLHMTAKPVEVMREIVRAAAPRDGIILDPFSGSGSTGVACAAEGRRFLGFERDAHHCDVANRRLDAYARGVSIRDDEVGQGALFDAPPLNSEPTR